MKKRLNGKNLIGQKFNKWTVLEFLPSKNGCGSYLICRCDCGSIKKVRAYHVIKGTSRGCCGCWKRKNLINKRFGKLEVVKFLKMDEKSGTGLCLCKCDCGTTKNLLSHH